MTSQASFSIRRILVIVLVLITPVVLLAQDYHYTLSWPTPQTHEYHITLTTDPQPGDHTVFQMPVWRPGRYIRQDYAAGVSNFEAIDRNGQPLKWRKITPSDWQVDNPVTGPITIRYRWYANVMDAGSSVLNPQQAYFNGVNLFMHVQDRYTAPCTLTLPDLPDDWKAATVLKRNAMDPRVFTAASYHELVDSPTILSPTLHSIRFEVDGATYYVHFQGNYGAGEAGDQRIREDFPRIIREQAALFGGVPMQEYHFIYQLVPQRMGHAVEHEYSSCYALYDQSAQSAAALSRLFSVTSHEFFHLWNVKRIRPAALWPYDYQNPPYTGLHWWTEGVTDYYTNLALVRTGLTDRDDYLDDLARQISRFESDFANRVVSPHDASFDSWLATSDYGNPNLQNSYYSLGSRVGLLLDLELRRLTDGSKGLDDVFRYLYATYYQKGLGVPEDGIQTACETVSGQSFQAFFDHHVSGTAPTDYADLFAPFGLSVSKDPNAGAGWQQVGIERVQKTDGNQLYLVSVTPGSDASRAGLGEGMAILEADGKNAANFDVGAFFSGASAGKKLPLKVWQNGEVVELTLKWSGKEVPYTYRISPANNATAAQRKLLEGWLSSKQGGRD